MFAAFHKESTRYLRVFRKGYWQNAIYETQGACTAAINREAAKGKIADEDYAVLPVEEFKKIEKTETKINLMSGKPFTQSVNTPMGCDPSTETYWCM